MAGSKKARRQKGASPRRRRRAQADLPDSQDEAATLIAETAANLADLARRHELEMLHHLLAMVQLEAEEHIRLRSKRKLS
jgi:hypothetical protein